MTSLTDLREVVDVLIGVGTHVQPILRLRSTPVPAACSTRSPSRPPLMATPNWWSSLAGARTHQPGSRGSGHLRIS
jgi:hypothetical protein